MTKDLSTIAKKRLGKTKAERSEKMRQLAKIGQAKLSKKQKSEHARKMLAARYKKNKKNGK